MIISWLTRLLRPSLMTMVPALIASSVGAGWTPSHVGLSDPAQNDPSKSSAALWEGRLQLRPDTTPDDPVCRKWGPRPQDRNPNLEALPLFSEKIVRICPLTGDKDSLFALAREGRPTLFRGPAPLTRLLLHLASALLLTASISFCFFLSSSFRASFTRRPETYARG